MKDVHERWYNLRLFIIRLRLNVCTLFSTHASTGWISSSFWVTWKTDLKITMTSRLVLSRARTLVRSRARALVRSHAKQCNSEKTYGRFRLYFNQALLTLKRRLALLELLVDTTSEKLENGALFLRGLGLPSTLTRLENGAFRRRSPNWRNLTKRFYRVRKTLWERGFSKMRAPR